MDQEIKEVLDRQIAKLERQIAKLERQRENIDDALEQLKKSRAALEKIPAELLVTDEEEDDDEGVDGLQPQKTHYDRIADFLRDVNDPQSIADIEFGTEIPRTSISAVLYRTHKDFFEPRSDPENNRLVRWVLIESKLYKKLHPVLNQEEEIPF